MIPTFGNKVHIKKIQNISLDRHLIIMGKRRLNQVKTANTLQTDYPKKKAKKSNIVRQRSNPTMSKGFAKKMQGKSLLKKGETKMDAFSNVVSQVANGQDILVGNSFQFFDNVKNHTQVKSVEFLKKAGTNEFSAEHSTQDILNEVLNIYNSPNTFREMNILKQIFKVLLYVAANFDDANVDSQHVNKGLLFLSAMFLQHNLPFQQGSLFKLLLLASIVQHVNLNRYHEVCKEIVRNCLLLLYHELRCLIMSSES